LGVKVIGAKQLECILKGLWYEDQKV
jgi:hypothetical protein